MNNLGGMLSGLGQREVALAVAREVVDLRRLLATRNPEAFQPDLAMSLNDLGEVLSELGQRDAALTATREAAALYQTLGMKNPMCSSPTLRQR